MGLSECGFVLFGDMGAGQGPGIRGLGLVIGSGDPAAIAGLAMELGDRQEEVGVVVQERVEAVEQIQELGGVIAVVADRAPDDRPVLLLDIGIVIASPRWRPQ